MVSLARWLCFDWWLPSRYIHLNSFLSLSLSWCDPKMNQNLRDLLFNHYNFYCCRISKNNGCGFGAWGYYDDELGFCFGFTWFARYGSQKTACCGCCCCWLQIWWIGRPITTNGVGVIGGVVIVLLKIYLPLDIRHHPQFSHIPPSFMCVAPHPASINK